MKKQIALARLRVTAREFGPGLQTPGAVLPKVHP